MRLFTKIAALLAIMWAGSSYASCNVDIANDFIIKNAKLKIFEYFGTYQADFSFPNFMGFDCTVTTPDSENPEWKVISWQLPENSPIRVAYKDAQSGRATQEDAIYKFSVSYDKTRGATYNLERGKVQTFFGGIRFILSTTKPPVYNLLRGAQVDLAIGPLEFTTK